jgi:hypothetical protein
MTYQPGPYDQNRPPQYQPQPPVTPGPGWPPQGQQPPAGWPPQPVPPKKRGPLPWILGAVGMVLGLCLIFGIIGAITGGGEKTNDTAADVPAAVEAGKTAATKPAAKAPAKKAGIGSKVRDGKFEFVVTGVDCSKTKVGDQYLNTTAQGRFCIVSVTVTNIGDEARTFTGGNQKAYAGKTEFSNDGEAELYLNSDSQTFLEDVNPGNTVKGKLVFDVPKSTKLTEVELHDGVFSGGVRVAL